jgi:integrase
MMNKSVKILDLESLPSLPLAKRGELPELSGVYLAIGGLGEVQYIGQAVNIRDRWVCHHRRIELEFSGLNVCIAWILVELPLLRHVEQALINYFKPPLNGLKNQMERAEKTKEYEIEHPPQSHNKKYSELRDREYLLEAEVTAMMKAARKGRWGYRDAALILMGYRHGLRISELISLRWQQVEFETGHLHVKRAKGSNPSTHPLAGDELRALRQLQRKNPDSPYIFISERGGPITADGARKMIRKAGEVAGLQFPVHPHMLRHGCGYYLAAKGIDTRAIQDYLGHANIHHTVRYTQLAPQRFEGFWQD